VTRIHSSTTKTLYANGCSFTAGSELEQDGGGDPPPAAAERATVLAYQRRHAWPQVLGALTGYPTVVNEAIGAGSNARAVRMTLRFVADYLRAGGNPGNLLVCIGLTDLKRGERYEDSSEGEDGWQLLKPRLSGPNATADRYARKCNRLYYRYLYSERQAVSILAQQVLLLQTGLATNGVALHLHNAMSVNREPLERWLPQTPEALLIDPDRYPLAGMVGRLVRPCDRSFEEWALAEGVATGLHGHPLIAGHRGWAGVLQAELERGGLLDRSER
jgi:uncharacterized protein DUF6071